MRAVTVALTGLAVGCSSPVEILHLGGLEVRADDDGVTLRNRTAATIYYFLVDVEDAPYIDWAACEDPSSCREFVQPSLRKFLRWEEVGYESSKSAYVYWWHLIPDGDRFRIDSFHSGIISARH